MHNNLVLLFWHVHFRDIQFQELNGGVPNDLDCDGDWNLKISI